MRLHALGDRAILIDLGSSIDEETHRLVRAVCARLGAAPIVGMIEYVPAFASVAVHYDPPRVPMQAGDARSPFARMCAALHAALASLRAETLPRSRVVEIPVCYGDDLGPDLEDLARAHGLTADEVIRLHTGPEYLVHMIGFVPGFPYLGGLPEALATPRRSVPRAIVPASSVGIGGSQTGIYPVATPGGWHLIGRTPLRLFDAQRDPPSLLAMGDRVRFSAISRQEFGSWPAARGAASEGEREPGTHYSSTAVHATRALRVTRAGLLTTVQDLGRRGWQRDGVPESGAMDRLALRLANLLVGNEERDAALEITLAGPCIAFEHDALVAITGADMDATVDGRPVQPWRAMLVNAGSELDIGGARVGCRAYLAVAGGIDVPLVLGSRSTYVRASFGGLEGRALRRGDVIPCGEPSALSRRIARALDTSRARASAGDWRIASSLRPAYGSDVVARTIPSARAGMLAPSSRAWLRDCEFRISPQSDRMGFRLEGEPIELAHALEPISEPVTFGTVQLPPGGSPIILMADHQTTGGYPRLGEVAAVDLPLLAQLKPGERVRLRELSLEEAQALYVLREQEIARLRHAISVRHT